MYDDYPTATYNSNVNQLAGLGIVLAILCIAVTVITIISIMRVYKKANRNPITAWIPLYNIIVLLEICNLPTAYLFFMLIPGVNIYFTYKLSLAIAKVYNKESKFGLGLFLLPFVFYPILGFSKSEYVGLDITGKDSSMQIDIIHEIDDVKTKEIEVEVNDQEDTASKNINISLGGGVYQKDYASNLSNVTDDDKIIKQQTETKQPEIIQPIIDEKPKGNDLFNVDYIETKPEEIIVSLDEQPQEEKKEEIIVPLDEPVQKEIVVPLENSTESIPVVEEPVIEENKDPEPLKTITGPNGEIVICPKCGSKIKSGTNICFMCGNKIA